VDVLAQGVSNIPDDRADHAWEELLVGHLSEPGLHGASSCVELHTQQQHHQHEAGSVLLRVRMPETFGDVRYTCVYGLEVLVYE
jgi:hypothetical protein